MRKKAMSQEISQIENKEANVKTLVAFLNPKYVNKQSNT